MNKKYIKTEDGTIREPEWGRETNAAVCCHKGGWVFFSSILKQADTIEELCDYFAFEDAFDSSVFPPIVFVSYTFAKLQAKSQQKTLIGYTVVKRKGVKTLEPAAKMNEKGELELL